MELIDKDALLAEINSLLDKGKYNEKYDCGYHDGNNNALYGLKNKLNTLEVKEVDLEKELIDWRNTHYSDKDYTFEGHGGHYLEISTIIYIAKYFFELGLKTKEK